MNKAQVWDTQDNPEAEARVIETQGVTLHSLSKRRQYLIWFSFQKKCPSCYAEFLLQKAGFEPALSVSKTNALPVSYFCVLAQLNGHVAESRRLELQGVTLDTV